VSLLFRPARGSVAHEPRHVAQRLPPTPASATPSCAECLLERLEQHQKFPPPCRRKDFPWSRFRSNFISLSLRPAFTLRSLVGRLWNRRFAGARCSLGVFLELFRAISFCPIISLFPYFSFSQLFGIGIFQRFSGVDERLMKDLE